MCHLEWHTKCILGLQSQWSIQQFITVIIKENNKFYFILENKNEERMEFMINHITAAIYGQKSHRSQKV